MGWGICTLQPSTPGSHEAAGRSLQPLPPPSQGHGGDPPPQLHAKARRGSNEAPPGETLLGTTNAEV